MWYTCADCSSLGLDKVVGNSQVTEVQTCNSCNGRWPARALKRGDIVFWQETYGYRVMKDALWEDSKVILELPPLRELYDADRKDVRLPDIVI